MTGAQISKKVTPAGEPSRVEKFRLELVKTIPRFPNNREALRHMQQKRLSDVLIDYIHWRARYVGKRPREIEIEPAAKADRRWSAMAAPIEAFLEKVRNGDDLTPYLSLTPHTRGYSLAAHTPGATNEDSWSDKDLLLTKMNYHHFHLGTHIEAAGHTARTNDLIFADVGRDKFKVIAIFNHDVFDQDSAERRRLSVLHSQIIFRGLPPGAGLMDGPVTPSGHAIHVVMYADYCGRWIESVDPELDDRTYIEKWYALSKIELPPKPKFNWTFLHLDLAVYESTKRTAFLVQQGWN
jgi:hypothetical protein